MVPKTYYFHLPPSYLSGKKGPVSYSESSINIGACHVEVRWRVVIWPNINSDRPDLSNLLSAMKYLAVVANINNLVKKVFQQSR